ncbi:MAG: peptide chain release factor 1 [Candidatus Ancillula sp.]|jgi:peptide chain release factor 1|nr:peptide chain release factor 1 [Candidatus Ancillula sp.]
MSIKGQFPAAEKALAEYEDIEKQLSDSAVHQDQSLARKLGRRYAALRQIVEAYRAWVTLEEDRLAALELAQIDASFAKEAEQLIPKLNDARAYLQEMLIPRDEDDVRDVIMEIKAGAGGEESALFAGDLLRMYLKFAERQGWKSQILDESPTDIGGYKDITVAFRNPNTDASMQEGVWANLKFEGGVHRVQRVPVTESQGRVHTSATGVYVYPEADDDDTDIEIPENDIRIDVFRSGGPGGQSVNTTDSAVRITHLPTGIVVSMQNEKSQIQNRAAGMKVLKSRLIAHKQEEEAAKNSNMRLSQVRTADRSERIRTYNFPENRIADHRTGYKAYNLDQVMDGALEDVVKSCIEQDEKHRLAQAE